ncbi:uncharacterized protein LOC118767362 [Octopus sinensis]|uniref:Uncharacterized protein LOC118767362 n=1 Tax=Octopus sinensis TaxID=2607531 RepID=A0A7E6FIV3_9MOLL|nr:uncharacterized protein LOC118767362 [Octopus sinensis]
MACKLHLVTSNNTLECTDISPVMYLVTYLGSIVANDGDTECNVACRIGKGLVVFQRFAAILAGGVVPSKGKVHLFNSIIIPLAIYVAEMWNTSAKILNVFELRHLRWIPGPLIIHTHL